MNQTTNLIARRGLLKAALLTSAAPSLALAQTSPRRANQNERNMRIRFSFAEQNFTATLYDNPSSRDLMSMLPLAIDIDDFSNNEKIAVLPRKLTEEGKEPFGNEAPGDLCYYIPWGNLALFYAGYRYSSGLIRLGRFDGGVESLLKRGKFPLRVERVA